VIHRSLVTNLTLFKKHLIHVCVSPTASEGKMMVLDGGKIRIEVN
jgi:hypothetical protein